MISILQQPYDLSFTGNSISFRVQSDQYILHADVTPSIKITVVAKPAVGNSFQFSFVNPYTLEPVQVSLLAVPSPSAIGHMPDSTFPGTLSVYVDALIVALKNIPILNAFYEFSKSGNSVVVNAKIADMNLIPTAWATSNGTTSFTSVIYKVAEKAVYRAGYEMKAEIYFEEVIDSNDFQLVSTLDMIVSPEGIAEIDLQEVIGSEIELCSMDEIPVPSLTVLSYQQSTVKRFYVKFVEYWTESPTAPFITSKVLFAHYGGIDTMEETDHAPQAQLAGSKRFMTMWPNGKNITLNQYDWLSWMNPNKTSEVFVQCRMYTNDAVVSQEMFLQSIKPFRTLTFQVGHDALGLLEYMSTGQTFNRWSFQVYDITNEPLSEEYFFHKVEANCKRNLILYFNSFGVPETFNTYADWTVNYNVSREISKRSEQFNISRKRAQRFSFNTVAEKSYIATSQYLKLDESESLAEILQSTQAFVYENNGFTPIIISSESISVFEQNKYLRQLRFEAIKAFVTQRNSNFSTQIGLRVELKETTNEIIPVLNDVIVDSFGTAKLYNVATGTLIESQSYNVALNRWIFAIPTEGNYEVRCLVWIGSKEFTVRYRYDLLLKTVRFSHSVVGLYKFNLGVNTAFDYAIDICWGDSSVFTSYLISGSTDVSHTYTIGGRKEVTLRSFSFDRIGRFIVDNYSAPSFYGVANNIEFSAMNKLEHLEFVSDAINSTTLFVNRLTMLKNLNCAFNAMLSRLDIGHHPLLLTINITECNFSAKSIEEFLLALWKFRKSYQSAPTITLLDNPGAGSNMTIEALAIINGTGTYVGEGLVSDYSFTIYY